MGVQRQTLSRFAKVIHYSDLVGLSGRESDGPPAKIVLPATVDKFGMSQGGVSRRIMVLDC